MKGIYELTVSAQNFGTIWSMLQEAPSKMSRLLMNDLQTQVEQQERAWAEEDAAVATQLAETQAALEAAKTKIETLATAPTPGFVAPAPPVFTAPGGEFVSSTPRT